MQATDVTPRRDAASAPASAFVRRIAGRIASFWHVLAANPKITFGLVVVALFILAALAAPLLTPYKPDAKLTLGSVSPSLAHPLGTTGFGQDMLAQLLYGARVSLLIGFIAAVGSTALQVFFGLTSGYFGGWIDEVLSLIMNIFLVLPGLPLAIVLAALASSANAANKNEFVVALVLLFTSWSYGARVLRAQTLSLKEREFVTAARAVGETPFRVVFAEILPNEIALVAATFVGTFVYAVGAEVALEFLGLGDASHASWGTILFWANNNDALFTGQWWQFIPAGLCVAVLCASLTFLNFGLDEIANPRLRIDPAHKKILRALQKQKAVAP